MFSGISVVSVKCLPILRQWFQKLWISFILHFTDKMINWENNWHINRRRNYNQVKISLTANLQVTTEYNT